MSPGTISGIMCFIVKSRQLDEVPTTDPPWPERGGAREIVDSLIYIKETIK